MNLGELTAKFSILNVNTHNPQEEEDPVFNSIVEGLNLAILEDDKNKAVELLKKYTEPRLMDNLGNLAIVVDSNIKEFYNTREKGYSDSTKFLNDVPIQDLLNLYIIDWKQIVHSLLDSLLTSLNKSYTATNKQQEEFKKLEKVLKGTNIKDELTNINPETTDSVVDIYILKIWNIVFERDKDNGALVTLQYIISKIISCGHCNKRDSGFNNNTACIVLKCQHKIDLYFEVLNGYDGRIRNDTMRQDYAMDTDDTIPSLVIFKLVHAIHTSKLSKDNRLYIMNKLGDFIKQNKKDLYIKSKCDLQDVAAQDVAAQDVAVQDFVPFFTEKSKDCHISIELFGFLYIIVVIILYMIIKTTYRITTIYRAI